MRNGGQVTIRELVALGFVEITQRGSAGNAGFRQPALYRLTYRHWGSHKQTTDEWRRITTIDDAVIVAERARIPVSKGWSKNKSPPPKTMGGPTPENRTIHGGFPPPKTMGTVPPPKTMSTSISCRGTPTIGRGSLGPSLR
jgi:hypothetical protein